MMALLFSRCFRKGMSSLLMEYWQIKLHVVLATICFGSILKYGPSLKMPTLFTIMQMSTSPRISSFNSNITLFIPSKFDKSATIVMKSVVGLWYFNSFTLKFSFYLFQSIKIKLNMGASISAYAPPMPSAAPVITTYPFPYLDVRYSLLTVFLLSKWDGTHFHMLYCL